MSSKEEGFFRYARYSLLDAGHWISYALKEFFATRKDALLTEIRNKAALDKDLEAKLQAACEEWKSGYSA